MIKSGRALFSTLFILIVAVTLGTTSVSAQDHPHDEYRGLGDLSDRRIDFSEAGTDLVGKRPVRVFTAGPEAGTLTGAVVRVTRVDEAAQGWFQFANGDLRTDWIPASTLGGRGSPSRLFAVHVDSPLASTRIRFAISGGPVQILSGGTFNHLEEDDALSIEWDVRNTSRGSQTGTIVAPHLVKRADWGASPFRGDPVPLARPNYEYITFHHTACCAAVTYEEAIAEVKFIQEFHQDGRGWSDIGYHFLLDQTGRLYQGRPFMNEGVDLDDTPILAQGAHVGGANTGNIGVSALGCYHPPEGTGCTDALSPSAYDSLITVLAFLSERYQVPPDRIRGHRDFSSTACPGDNNYGLLAKIRRDVAALLESGNTPVGAADLAAASDEDGVVRLQWSFTRDDGIVAYRLERLAAGEDDAVVLFESRQVEDLTFVDGGVRSLGMVTYRLMARGTDGRWAPLAIASAGIAAPAGFRLSQSYPNPAQGRATVRYFVETEGLASLVLFDAAGRQVSVLAEAFAQSGLWNTVELDLAQLAPGTYYYRLQVEGFSGIVFDETRSLAVIK